MTTDTQTESERCLDLAGWTSLRIAMRQQQKIIAGHTAEWASNHLWGLQRRRYSAGCIREMARALRINLAPADLLEAAEGRR